MEKHKTQVDLSQRESASTDNIDEQISECLKILKTDKPDNAYEICRKLSRFVKALIVQRDVSKFKKWLAAINDLHHKAHCFNVRIGIENVFIYKIGDVIALQKDRKLWTDILPKTLRRKMFEQFFASSI
jgi:hypothetical protein